MILLVDVTFFPCGHNIGIQYYEQSIRGERVFGCPCRKSKFPSKIPCPKPKSNCKSPAIFGESASGDGR
jgi:hypothetical protein